MDILSQDLLFFLLIGEVFAENSTTCHCMLLYVDRVVELLLASPSLDTHRVLSIGAHIVYIHVRLVLVMVSGVAMASPRGYTMGAIGVHPACMLVMVVDEA